MKKVLGRIENRVRIGEERFLYLRELDEIILPLEEVLDYRAYLDDKDRLVLEVTVKDGIDFTEIKEEVMRSIRNLLSNQSKCGLSVEIVKAAVNEPASITDSMVKRKIIDYRKER